MPMKDFGKKIDKEKVINYLAKLIAEELDRTDLSEKKLGWLMGKLSQGTINKLRQGKFRNIPDFDTLEAIAGYFGLSCADFFIQITTGAEVKRDEEELDRLAIARVYQTKSDIVLAEIACAASAQLRASVFREQDKD